MNVWKQSEMVKNNCLNSTLLYYMVWKIKILLHMCAIWNLKKIVLIYVIIFNLECYTIVDLS